MPALAPDRLLFGRIPWYGLLIVTGVVLAIWLASREEKVQQLPEDTVIDLTLWMLPIGILGARLYFVVFRWSDFASDPIRILYIWEGGLAIYGGVIAGFLTTLVFCRVRKISLPVLCDVIAPGLVLAQAIGRWGNYFNREAFGCAVTDPRLQFFPFAVLIPENGDLVWHMATFFYESMWNFCVFIFLMCLRRKMSRKGDVFLWYLLLYGCGRLVIESFRMDSLYLTAGLRVSQILAGLLAIAVLTLFFLRTISVNRKRGIIACVVFFILLMTDLLLLPALMTNAGPLARNTLQLILFSSACVAAALILYPFTVPEV